jgi:hypothetical protein
MLPLCESALVSSWKPISSPAPGSTPRVRGPTEVPPPLAVPVLEGEHELIARVRAWGSRSSRRAASRSRCTRRRCRAARRTRGRGCSRPSAPCRTDRCSCRGRGSGTRCCRGSRTPATAAGLHRRPRRAPGSCRSRCPRESAGPRRAGRAATAPRCDSPWSARSAAGRGTRPHRDRPRSTTAADPSTACPPSTPTRAGERGRGHRAPACRGRRAAARTRRCSRTADRRGRGSARRAARRGTPRRRHRRHRARGRCSACSRSSSRRSTRSSDPDATH